MECYCFLNVPFKNNGIMWLLLRSTDALIEGKERLRTINRPLKVKLKSQHSVTGNVKKKKKKRFSSLNLGHAEKTKLRKLS